MPPGHITFVDGTVPIDDNLNAVSDNAVSIIDNSIWPTSPIEGQTVRNIDDGRVYTFDGTDWNLRGWYNAGGAIGFYARRTSSQNVINATPTVVGYDLSSSDPDGFITSLSTGTVVIPTGLGGLYMSTVRLWLSTYPGAFASYVEIVVDTTTYYRQEIDQFADRMVLTMCRPLAEGTPLHVGIYQTSGSTIAIDNARWDTWWVGPA